MLKKIEIDLKQMKNGSKAAFGDLLHNLSKASVELIEEAPKLGKNKSSPFESPITPDIDKEMKSLRIKGLDSRQISAELAKQGTMITWQRVQRRIAFLSRKKPHEVPQSSVTKSKSSELQRSYPAKMPASQKQVEHLDISSDLAERIIMLSIQKFTPHSISDTLEEESGSIISESQVMTIIFRKARGEI
jgi:hypothetical protein